VTARRSSTRERSRSPKSRPTAASGRCVALLRGINVGRAKRVAMADLRALVEELGYGDVRTLLNSGNVVFTAPRVSPSVAARRIEEALVVRTGVTSRVTVLTADELDRIVSDNPLLSVATDPTRSMVVVLRDARDAPRLQPLAVRDWSPEVLGIGERVAYLWCPDGILVSPLTEAVGKLLGDAITMRNWATTTKLHALLESTE
jgi:uncharacterized protein (DUF1697 family)